MQMNDEKNGCAYGIGKPYYAIRKISDSADFSMIMESAWWLRGISK